MDSSLPKVFEQESITARPGRRAGPGPIARHSAGPARPMRQASRPPQRRSLSARRARASRPRVMPASFPRAVARRPPAEARHSGPRRRRPGASARRLGVPDATDQLAAAGAAGWQGLPAATQCHWHAVVTVKFKYGDNTSTSLRLPGGPGHCHDASAKDPPRLFLLIRPGVMAVRPARPRRPWKSRHGSRAIPASM